MSEATWYVLEVAGQRELEITVKLREGGLLAMVPTERRYRRTRSKQGKPVLLPYVYPLMPGYVFAGSHEKSKFPWLRVRSMRDVWGVVSFHENGWPAELSDRDIDMIRQMAKDTKPTGGSLKAGDQTRITSGPFANIEGLAKAIGRDKVVVSVHLFGAERDLTVAVGNVEKV